MLKKMIALFVLCSTVSVSAFAMPKAQLDAGVNAGAPEALVEMGEIYLEAKDGLNTLAYLTAPRLLAKGDEDSFSKAAQLLAGGVTYGYRGASYVFLAAGKGNLQAQYDLLYMYKNGKGVQKDEELAQAMADNLLPRLQIAAAAGDVNSMSILGIMHLEGTGTEKNEVKGFDYLDKAAKRGDMEAKMSLAFYYFDKQDIPRGLLYLQDAAERGDRKAQLYLGLACKKGEYGLAQDNKNARKWLQAAAEQGDLNAQVYLMLVK